MPGAGSDDVKPTTAETEATTQLLQTIIIGNHAGNIANASPGAIQTVHVVERGDLQGLVAALTRYGVPASEIDELRGVVEEEKNLTAIGPKASQWLAKASTAVASGTWKLGQVSASASSPRQFSSTTASGEPEIALSLNCPHRIPVRRSLLELILKEKAA